MKIKVEELPKKKEVSARQKAIKLRIKLRKIEQEKYRVI